jgi:hypothetical protein
MVPFVIVITLLRTLFTSYPPPPPTPPADSGAEAVAMALPLPTHTAYAALHVALHRLELAGIRNQHNIRRLLAEPQNLALVYAMERLTHFTYNPFRVNLIANQQIFDFLLENRDFWTDVRIIENLDVLLPVDNLDVQIADLQRTVDTPVARLAQEFNDSQSTHRKSVHDSTAKSATRLQQIYSSNHGRKNVIIDASIAQRLRSYDNNLVGQRTDDEIVASLKRATERFENCSFQDPASGVTSKLLMQYCWSAVQDSTQWREGVTEETAEACFYAALYETDREYALSDAYSDEVDH